MINVKILNKSDNPLPQYETSGSAGMDVFAYIGEKADSDSKRTIKLQPQNRKLIHTGLYVGIPEGYEMQVRTRSGLAIKFALVVLNSPGTVDSDYRGEVGIIACNLSDQVITITSGDRIAQLVFTPVEHAKWENVDTVEELGSTDRGSGGFGHTGIN